eukprot:scaffold4518_cov410-Prasinococcus_capsulatus_cf.AAC.30
MPPSAVRPHSWAGGEDRDPRASPVLGIGLGDLVDHGRAFGVIVPLEVGPAPVPQLLRHLMERDAAP